VKRTLISSALAVAFVAGVSAQDARTFEGTWRNDMSRSKTGSGMVGPDQTITVDGSKMTVTQTSTSGNSSSKVLLLDGTPSKEWENVVITKWEGDVLVTTTSAPSGGERIEKRSMEPDGAMRVDLIYNRRMPGAPATESYHRVYTKIK
jgi:hypothetical protein